MAVAELELLWAVRAFPESQRIFEATGVPGRRLPGLVDVGWHGTETEPIAGATCVLGVGGDQALRGEVLRISRGPRRVFVYVLGVRAVPVPYSISRRAFLGLGLLALDSIPCVIEVVE